MGRRMSYRQSAAARKEIRRLTDEVRRLRGDYGSEVIARGVVCDTATSAVRTARKLGFTVLVEESFDGKELIARAVRKEG